MKTIIEIIDAYAHTNDPPSDFDRKHISHLVQHERSTVEILDAKIVELRAQLAEARSQRRKRRENIEKLSAITSPLRHLPPEILSLIFMACPRTTDLEDSIMRNPSPLLAPLLLVRICSRWRHIALATPMLWTELQLTLDESPWKMVLFNNYCVNAGQLPISLAASCGTPYILSRFLTRTRRFKALRLQLSNDSIRDLAATRHRALHVDAQSLRIDIRRHQIDPYSVHHSYSSFQHSPSLREFTLSSTHIEDPAFLRFVLPWAQLTRLRVDEPLLFSAMHVLVQCINLAQCRFGTLVTFDEDDVALHERTTFPSLTQADFSFDYLDSDSIENYFGPLILPALKKFVLRSDAIAQWSPTAFSSFQARSAFVLESLELHKVPLITDDLTALLECLPSLKSFTTMDIIDPVAFFRVFTCDSSTPLLLPQLERLTIGFVQSDDSFAPCIAMIRSRRKWVRPAGTPSVSRLRYLHIVSYRATLALDRWWWQWKDDR
ncbi:hypothetical protein B0H11DRAFT_2063019 [Mycena galericulata]|nr:hypothetical protein B0H11DRAFT_2063019 [Mycena galericulata]